MVSAWRLHPVFWSASAGFFAAPDQCGSDVKIKRDRPGNRRTIMLNSQLRERVVLCCVTPPVVGSVPIEHAVHQLRLLEPDGELAQAARAIGICLGE
jgi:hypothetical protein